MDIAMRAATSGARNPFASPTRVFTALTRIASALFRARKPHIDAPPAFLSDQQLRDIGLDAHHPGHADWSRPWDGDARPMI
jgi:hypothetical protein